MSASSLPHILEKLKTSGILSKGWLLKRLRSLSPGDFSTLMEFMTQETYLPLLSAISQDFSLPREFRSGALEARKNLGDSTAPGEEGLLEEEQSIRQTFFNFIADENLEEHVYTDDLINKLISLPEPLAKAILQDGVKEKGEAVLPFLKRIYQNAPDSYGRVAMEVLANVIAPESKLILQEIAVQGKDKASQKLAKKLLYRLRDVEFPSETIQQDTKTSSKSILTMPDHNIIKRSWASFIDGRGSRIIHLIKSQPMGQIQLITLFLSDTEGIMDCQCVVGPKKAINPIIEEHTQTKHIIEMAPSYATALIAEYQEINKKAARELPRDFFPALGHSIPSKADSKLEPLIYQEIAATFLGENPYYLRTSSELFKLEEFSSWNIPSEELEKYLIRLREIEQSLIIVSEYLQAERKEAVYQEAVKAFFSPEKRSIYRRRLEEMAYYLWVTERQEQARLALEAAFGLEDKAGDKILEHPFARELVYRSIEAVKD